MELDVTESLEMLRAAGAQSPTWSSTYGGPAGVERHARSLQHQLARLSEEAATLRAHALRAMLTDRSVKDVAGEIGITRQAVEKIVKRIDGYGDLTW